jgi:hypothetical protein
MNASLASDVAAASAAYLFNCLPELTKLPASECFQRLEAHIHTSIIAYLEGLRNWGVPEPSKN